MEFKERPPIETALDREPKVENHDPLGYDHLEQDLLGAIQAVGPDEVVAALMQVEQGKASAAELLAWIDQLRDPETEVAEPDQPPLGFNHDFEYDTEIDPAAQAAKTDEDEAATAEQDTESSGFGDDGDDGHYMFSAVRKRGGAEDGDGDGDGGGGGGGGGGDGDDNQPKPDPAAAAASDPKPGKGAGKDAKPSKDGKDGKAPAAKGAPKADAKSAPAKKPEPPAK